MKQAKKEMIVSLCLFVLTSLHAQTFQLPESDRLSAWMHEMGITHEIQLTQEKVRIIENNINAYVCKVDKPFNGAYIIEQKPQKLPRHLRDTYGPWEYMTQASEDHWRYKEQEHQKKQEHFYAFQHSANYRKKVLQRIDNSHKAIYGMFGSLAIHRLALAFEPQPQTKREDVFTFYETQLQALFFYKDGSLRPLLPSRHQSEFFYYMLRETLPTSAFNEYIKTHDFHYRNEIIEDQKDSFLQSLTNTALNWLNIKANLATSFWSFPTRERITQNFTNINLQQLIDACKRGNFNQAQQYAYAGGGLAPDIIDHYRNKFQQEHFDKWGIANAFGKDPSWRNLNDQEKAQLVSQIPSAQINQQLMEHDKRKKDLQQRLNAPDWATQDVHDVLYQLAHGTDAQMVQKLHEMHEQAKNDPKLKQSLANLNSYLPENMRTLADHYDDAQQATNNLSQKIESAKTETAQEGLQAQKKAIDQTLAKPFDVQKSHAPLNEQAQQIVDKYGNDKQFKQDITGNPLQRHIHQEIAESLNTIATDPHIQDKELPDKFYQSTLEMARIAQEAAAHGDFDKACAISHYLATVAQFSEHIHDDEYKTLDTLQQLFHHGSDDVLNDLPDEYQDVMRAGAYAITSGFGNETTNNVLSNMATMQKGEFERVIHPDMQEISGHIGTTAGSLCGLGLNSFFMSRDIGLLIEGDIGQIFPLTVSTCAAVRDVYHIFHELNQINAQEYYVNQHGDVEQAPQYPEISANVDKVTYSVVLAGTIVYAAQLIRAGCRFIKRAWDARSYYLKVPLNALEAESPPKLPRDHPIDMIEVDGEFYVEGHEPGGPFYQNPPTPEPPPSTSNPRGPPDDSVISASNGPLGSGGTMEKTSGGVTKIKEPNKATYQPAKVLQALKNVTQEVPRKLRDFSSEQLVQVQKGQALYDAYERKIDEAAIQTIKSYGNGTRFNFTLEHSLRGHIKNKKGGKEITGVHSLWLHKDCKKRITRENKKKGIYQIDKLEVDGFKKSSPSTMWPDTYGPVEIARDTAQALNNIEHVTKNKMVVLQGRAESGILVEIQLDINGDIYTSYPALKDKNEIMQI